ncbi:MAG: hypothetical protein A4E27_00162 [Methanobacterium sp. PtaU1.Bin242]|nr:MAG: hypothetical protein A4E27_00162 [Methanobacterium sp. PtaU1.Bin242]
MDETYIQMCREAKEIQGIYESRLCVGDLVFDELYGYIRIEGYGNVDTPKHKAVWLPRQEDLQRIYLNSFKEPTSEIMAFIEFKDWVL